MVGDKLCQHRQHSHKGHQHEVVELQKVDHNLKDHQISPATASLTDTEPRYLLNWCLWIEWSSILNYYLLLLLLFINCFKE